MITSSLNRSITIESKTQTTRSSGAPYDSWSTYCSVYANMFIRNGGMKDEIRSSVPQIGVEWTIRYRDDIDYDMRISYEGHKYKIEFIEELGRKEGLKIFTTALKFDNLN